MAIILMLAKRLFLFFWFLTLPFWPQQAAYGAVGGKISGTVMDGSGAVISTASVSANNLDTGVQQTVTTNRAGVYSISNLAVAHYDITISAPGFRPYRRAGVVVDVNSMLLVDAVLELGPRSETVTVNDSAVHVEASSTQLGDVIAAANIGAMPLNGRSYTDLLALQPGVVPATTITSLTVQGLGQSVFLPSGDLNREHFPSTVRESQPTVSW